MIYNKFETRNPHFLKHGMSGTKVYKTWHNMRSRCNNPKATKYEIYGGRGIKVCDEWENSFHSFYDWCLANGYEEGLTIDRINGDGNYEPSNCRWVDYKVQNNNLSTSVKIYYNGKEQSVGDWANEIGVTKKCLSERLRRGWTIERALTTPKIRIENFGNFIKERKLNDI